MWLWVALLPRWALPGPQVPGMGAEGLESLLSLLHSWSPPLLVMQVGCLHSADSRVNPADSLPQEGLEPPQATPTFCTGEEMSCERCTGLALIPEVIILHVSHSHACHHLRWTQGPYTMHLGGPNQEAGSWQEDAGLVVGGFSCSTPLSSQP